MADLLCVAGQRNARENGCETLIAGKVVEAIGPIRNDPAIDGTLTDILSGFQFLPKPYAFARVHRASSDRLNELEEIDSSKPCANSESGSEQAAPDNWPAIRDSAKL